ncbi:MAG: hypothetical protein ACYCX7_03615 [Solirubrobacteraceae bacterium]
MVISSLNSPTTPLHAEPTMASIVREDGPPSSFGTMLQTWMVLAPSTCSSPVVSSWTVNENAYAPGVAYA